MKFKILIATYIAVSAQCFSLEEGFSYLNESERIKIAILSYERALNNQQTLKSAILPEINLNSTYTKTNYNESATLDDTTSKTLAINFNQPLFRGLREFNALAASKYLTQAKDFTREVLLRSLKEEFTSQYFNFLTLKKDYELTKLLLDTSNKRLAEIEGRVRIGKSKKADLYQARSQVYVAQSALSEAQTKLDLALVNISNTLNVQIKDKNFSEPALISTLKENPNLENHPIIKSIGLQKEVARLDLKSSKAAHLPTLDLKGNYYLGGESFNSNKNWDASLNFSLPIYSGGETNSTITDKSLALNEIEHNYSNELRNLKTKTYQIEVDYQNSSKRLELLNQAKDSLRISYEEIQKEYSLGLVTTLDVIQSLNQYIDAEKNYYKTYFSLMAQAYNHKIITENL